MPGIYFHIPFCRKACHYCNFHFSTNLSRADEVVGAMQRELELRAGYLSAPLDTVYFGGGTPSLLEAAQVRMLIERSVSLFGVAPNAEITLEANPDDLSPGSLAAWLGAGINRLSVGLQSFQERELRWMNRAHDAAQAKDAIGLIRQAGFENFSIDLIYGSPLLEDAVWEQTLHDVTALHVPHVSAYALTVEPGTALGRKVEKHQEPDTDPDRQRRQFEMLREHLIAAGYAHYEISNFALPGFESRHNSSYWAGAHYLGIGPSAHSFNGTSRQWNVANNALYLQGLAAGIIPFEKEELDAKKQLNEYLMTALRTSRGISLQKLQEGWAFAFEQVMHAAQPYLDKRLLRQVSENLQLTPKGLFLADGIAAALFQ